MGADKPLNGREKGFSLPGIWEPFQGLCPCSRTFVRILPLQPYPLLRLRHISLVQFRNHGSSGFRFENRVTAFTGRNGAGKTGLLDGIHYLSCTKSYFHPSDQPSIQFGKDGFRVEGTFSRDGPEDLVACILREKGKKEFLLNGSPYARFSEHIGQFPAVMIAPDDAAILTGISAERRKFLDILLSQMDPVYLDHLIGYGRVLHQRNSHLKLLSAQGSPGDDLLDALDQQISAYGTAIHAIRSPFLEHFLPRVQRRYDELAGSHELVEIIYRSGLSAYPYPELLTRNRHRDIELQRTTAGIHRDDLEFLMDGHFLKTSGSQGQRKTFIFALKLAQYECIREKRGLLPLLLLDDVFERLDSERISRLIAHITGPSVGQIFLSDTDPFRVKRAFEGFPETPEVLELEGG